LTDRVLSELKRLYMETGGNLSLTCSMVGVQRDTYYKYIKKHPSFANEMERVKGARDSLAERNIHKAIKAGDIVTTKWYKEKTDERYNPKTHIESKSLVMNLSKDISELTQEELLDLIKDN